jgi:hypothetical protein
MLGKRIVKQYLITNASIAELLQGMNEDVRTFFKQQVNLLKKEMSDKVSTVARDAMVLRPRPPPQNRQ